MTDDIPAHIGRFQIQSLLGRGAMGVVYRGHDPEIDRPVAIKLVRADLLDGDEREAYLERFRNEAKIAGRCMHANIVGIYDFAMFEGNPYLVMEYVDGVGLNGAVARGTRLSMREAVPIALQVLEALDYAHRFGIVHRDIKPANILLTRHARLKVTDFGISRFASNELTAIPLMIGTPSYMSPEQCAGDPIDQRSDLFSLGCILYELLAGERPFQGISYTETIFRLVNQPHAPLATLRPDLPSGLGEILDRALAKRPGQRFDDAAGFAAALRSVAPPATEAPAAVSGIRIPKVPGPPDAATPDASPDAAAPDASGPGNPLLELEPELLETIIRRLALRVGPMARVYVRRSLRKAASPEMLCALLSDSIADESERSGFLNEAQALLQQQLQPQPPAAVAPEPPPPLPPPPSPGLTEADIARTTTALAQVIGPIARQVVRRAVVRSTDAASLAEFCETYVTREPERARFRRLLVREFKAARPGRQG